MIMHGGGWYQPRNDTLLAVVFWGFLQYGVLYQDGILSSSDRAQFDLKDSVWKLLEDMLVALEPFKEATEICSSASKPTISSVYVVLNNILPRLETLETDSRAMSELKKTLRRKHSGRPS